MIQIFTSLFESVVDMFYNTEIFGYALWDMVITASIIGMILDILRGRIENG